MPTKRTGAPVREAATLKAQAQSLLRDLDGILGNKDISEDLASQFKALRTSLKKKWSDLAAIDEGKAEEAAGELAVRGQRLLREAGEILMQDDSFAGTQALVQAALDAIYAMSPGDFDWAWDYGNERACICDLYDDDVVYRYEGRLWVRDYSIDDTSGDDVVTLGDPMPVEAAYVPDVPTRSAMSEGGRASLGRPLMRLGEREGCFLPASLLERLAPTPEPPAPDPEPQPVTESLDLGEVVPLVEKAVRDDGSMLVKIISPGWGSSGYYSPDVLKRDGPKIFTEGMQMFWNHQTSAEEVARPEGDLRDLAGVLTSGAEYRANGEAGEGLYANAKAFGPYREAIDELAPHIGTSIRAMGKAATGTAEGRTGKLIQELTAGQSVDFVTQPGRGGEVVQLFEAARARAHASTPPSGGSAVDETEARRLRESLDALKENNTQLMEQLRREREQRTMRDIRDVLRDELGQADLPHEMVRERLFDSLQREAPVKDGELDADAFKTKIREAVSAEVAYISRATGLGSGRIVGMGRTSGGPAREEVESKLGAGFKRLGLSESAAASAASGR